MAGGGDKLGGGLSLGCAEQIAGAIKNSVARKIRFMAFQTAPCRVVCRVTCCQMCLKLAGEALQEGLEMRARLPNPFPNGRAIRHLAA